MAILEVNNLKKIYTTRFGGNQVQALTNVTFSVEKGEYVAIMGESGSGKTTLLNILAALDRATAGLVLLNGKNLSSGNQRWLLSVGKTWALSSRTSTCWTISASRIIFSCPWYWLARNMTRCAAA